MFFPFENRNEAFLQLPFKEKETEEKRAPVHAHTSAYAGNCLAVLFKQNNNVVINLNVKHFSVKKL